MSGFVPIPDYPNYVIDRTGCVMSPITKAPLCVYIDDTGYAAVMLFKNNKGRRHRLHRLLARLFIPNPDNKPFVDHINRIKSDYRLENLRWVTHGENVINTAGHSNIGMKNIYMKKSKDGYEYIVVQIRRNHIMVLNKHCATIEEAILLRDTFLESYIDN